MAICGISNVQTAKHGTVKSKTKVTICFKACLWCSNDFLYKNYNIGHGVPDVEILEYFKFMLKGNISLWKIWHKICLIWITGIKYHLSSKQVCVFSSWEIHWFVTPMHAVVIHAFFQQFYLPVFPFFCWIKGIQWHQVVAQMIQVLLAYNDVDHNSQQAEDDKNAQRNDVLHCLWFNSAATRCGRHVCGIRIICGLQKHVRCEDSSWSCRHCKIKHPIIQCHHTVTSWAVLVTWSPSCSYLMYADGHSCSSKIQLLVSRCQSLYFSFTTCHV